MNYLSKKQFFTGPTLTTNCTTALWGFHPEAIDEYRDGLKRILSLNAKNQDILADLTWDFDRIKLNGTRLFRSLIVAKTETSTHRICLLYPNNTPPASANNADDGPDGVGVGVLFTVCSPHVMSCLLEFLTKTFDCAVKPLKLSREFMLGVFEDYVVQSLAEDRLQGFSQLVYTVASREPTKELTKEPPKDSKEHEMDPPLSRITLDLRPSDLRHIYSTLGGDGSLMNAIYNYLQRHTTLRFDKMNIARVYCAGFVLTKNARVKFYDRGIEEAELWAIVGKMFAVAQTRFHGMP